jgi:hypothetical protein
MRDFAVLPTSLRPTAFDPELPRLAASAALEADLALNDPEADIAFDALKQLFARLPNAFPTQGNGEQGPNALLDPLSQDLFRRALAKSINKNTTAKSFEELQRATESLLQAGRSAEAGSASLIDIRNFCVALSNYAAARVC